MTSSPSQTSDFTTIQSSSTTSPSSGTSRVNSTRMRLCGKWKREWYPVVTKRVLFYSGSAPVTERLPAAERLANPAAVLTRADLREFGSQRRAIEAIVRALLCCLDPWRQTLGSAGRLDARSCFRPRRTPTCLASCRRSSLSLLSSLSSVVLSAGQR